MSPSSLPRLEIRPQFFFQRGLQAVRADDADVGNPLAHGGQYLVDVGHLAGHDQPAVFQLFFNYLVGYQFAAFEVVRHGRGDLQHHFQLFIVQPNVVFCGQGFFNGRVGAESGVGDLQAVDLGKGKRLELVAVFARQIPNTVVVHQFVGLDVGVGFWAFVFSVLISDLAAGQNGLLQLPKAVFFPPRSS